MTEQTWITTPITTPITEDLVRGASELERTPFGALIHRLPTWAREQWADPQLSMAESQPSGVRLVFRSTTTAIELDLLRTRTAYRGLPARPDGVVELVVNGDVIAHAVTAGGITTTIDLATGAADRQVEPQFTARFDALASEMKNIEIWLPHNEIVELVALRTDAAIEPPAVADRPVWLHHGSSISQGSNATRPTEIWPVAASRLGGVELTNLGFGGSMMLDPFMARTMRDTPADVISVKIGINLVNADLMRLRAFGPAVHGFLDTIREGHPLAPLLVVSPIFCAIHESTPGPCAFDPAAVARGEVRFMATGDPKQTAAGALTLAVIRNSLAAIVQQRQKDDANLHYLDGRELYAEADTVAHPLPDALHPDAATHRIIAERFARAAFAPGAPLATQRSDACA